MIATISLEGIRFFAKHGLSEAERETGTTYEVFAELQVDIKNAGFHDDIHQTVNYQDIYKLIALEMNQPRKLLETLVVNICGKLLGHSDRIKSIHVKVCKLNPPLGGICEKSCVEYRTSR